MTAAGTAVVVIGGAMATTTALGVHGYGCKTNPTPAERALDHRLTNTLDIYGGSALVAGVGAMVADRLWVHNKYLASAGLAASAAGGLLLAIGLTPS
jgi:predicted ABC-type sugar transport system permease subunit